MYWTNLSNNNEDAIKISTSPAGNSPFAHEFLFSLIIIIIMFVYYEVDKTQLITRLS